MVTYPRLNIDRGKIAHNSKIICDRCAALGISVVAVTKSVLAHTRIVEAMASGKIDMLGDSRLDNLRQLRANFNYPLMQLRTPMLSEAGHTAAYSQVSACTQIEAARLINQVCGKKGITHSVMVMLDTDDQREGLLPYQVLPFCRQLVELENIKVMGLGTNARCISSKKPSYESLSAMVELKHRIYRELGIAIPVLSGGNSSLLDQVFGSGLPEGINQLRIGEAILLGHETLNYSTLEGAHRDCFTLEAEIIEVKENPRKAIVALGLQDADAANLKPAPGMEIVGQSSDHTVLESRGELLFAMGHKITFNINYFSLLSTMTSPFVYKNFIGQ